MQYQCHVAIYGDEGGILDAVAEHAEKHVEGVERQWREDPWGCVSRMIADRDEECDISEDAVKDYKSYEDCGEKRYILDDEERLVKEPSNRSNGSKYESTKNTERSDARRLFLLADDGEVVDDVVVDP